MTDPVPSVHLAANDRSVLRSSLWIMLAGLALILVAASSTLTPAELSAPALLIVAVLFAQYLLHSGKVAAASYSLLATLLCGGIIAVVSYGSMRSISSMAFVGAVVTAGIFLGRRALIATILVTSAIAGGLVYAESAGMMNSLNRPVGLAYWIGFSVILMNLGLVVHYSHFLATETFARQQGEIEARKQVEEGLRQMEERLRLSMEVAQQGWFDLDVSTGEVKASAQFARIVGAPPEDHQMNLRTWFKSIHDDDRSGVARAFDECLETGETRQMDYRMKAQSGEWKWIRSIAKVVEHDANGKPQRMTGTHADITERKKAEGKIEELAFFDQLTGLPNRTLLQDRLKQALTSSARSARHGALLFLDLDNFKTLNDTLGHDIGDLLLQQVAQRLTASVRDGDTVARLGGDEFVVMLEDLSENALEAAAQTETVGEKILASLNQIYKLAQYEHHSTPSIGVTLFADHHGTMDDLLKRADLAMYQAKAAGRNTLRFFDPEMQAVVTTRAALDADLREAVLKDQFLLYYQPQVDGAGGLTGVEVLLRWQHPIRGLISPLEFIPLAEDTGLILPLGRWVLEEACAQLKFWATRPEMAHITVAVNVSAHQFHRTDFVDQVLALLDRTGADPRRLKLELTESLLVADIDGIIKKMAALKARGVCFSLDDFGTGYSSLSYLKRLPLDQLKIDKSFVHDILTDPNDAAIAKTVVALAESMGLTVIAEGVEVEAQKEFLARNGCHAYQGYLFSRPLPILEFERYANRA